MQQILRAALFILPCLLFAESCFLKDVTENEQGILNNYKSQLSLFFNGSDSLDQESLLAAEECTSDSDVTVPEFLLIISVKTGEPCGFLSYIALNEIGSLQTLFIEEPSRGLGLGKESLAHFEERMKKLGMKKTILSTLANNTAALHLYQKAGYQTIETIEEGSYFVYLMEKAL